MYRDLVSALGDTVLLRDDGLAEFRPGVMSASGWVVATLYLPECVERALLRADVRVARVLHGTNRE